MINEVEIRLWDQIVGYAAYRDSQLVHFEYEETFPSIYDLAPIMMPRERQQVWSFDLNHSSYHGLPGLLADALPDKYGNQVIDAWFASQGIALSEVSALDRLCYLGTRAMGALEFYPNQSDKSLNNKIQISRLVDLSQQILDERRSFRTDTDELEAILQIGSSAGGARAKAVIALNPETDEIRSGQIYQEDFEYWLIKLDGVGGDSVQGYTNIEYAYYLIAIDCGIEMTESKLLEEHGRNHFITKRFDRTDQGEKSHMQTLCALAHVDYNEARVNSYELLFRVANLLALSMHDKEQVFKRMVFNVVGRNHDDHSKNFSFLMDQDAKWQLSPAYDLSYAYNPDNYWLREHNLLINGKSKDIIREDLLVYARDFGIKIKNADAMIDLIIDRFSEFKDYANQAQIDKDKSRLITRNLRLDL